MGFSVYKRQRCVSFIVILRRAATKDLKRFFAALRMTFVVGSGRFVNRPQKPPLCKGMPRMFTRGMPKPFPYSFGRWQNRRF